MTKDDGGHETVLVTRDGPVATVTLHRPDVRNAFNPGMIERLTRVFLDLGRDADCRVVVLAGAGPTFSAGADLGYMRATSAFGAEDNVADALRLADLFTTVRDCPKPVVARVHGAAMGGGIGLVAACDIAVAAAGTRFAFSEVRLGIVPAVISPIVLPRIGPTAARELFLTGERFDAARALTIGLVTRVVPAEELDAAVRERVTELLRAAPGAQAAVKRLIPFVGQHPFAARDDTARMIAERRASDEGRAGMAAFLDKRAPPWAAEAEARDRAAESETEGEGAS